MASDFFGQLSAAVPQIDNQTTIAVQSLLDSQTSTEPPPVDDEDVFQCGKCKKQFTSLATFVNHKQSRCVATFSQGKPDQVEPSSGQGAISVSNIQAQNSAFTPNVRPVAQPMATFTTVSPNSLQQISQGMALGEEFMFNSVEPTIQTSSIQVQGVQSNPYLTQVTALPSRTVNNLTIINPVNTSSVLTSSTPAFSPNSITQIQIPASSQQITLTPVANEKPVTPQTIQIAKPTPTKAGRRLTPANVILVPEAEMNSISKARHGKGDGSSEASSKKKLRCQYCDKGFTKNFDLQQHIRAHTGEKPFQCIVCGRAFSQKSNVKKHMASHKVWPTGLGSTLPKQPEPEMNEDEKKDDDDVNNSTENNEKEISEPSPTDDITTKDESLEPRNENTVSDEEKVPEDAEEQVLHVKVDNSYICQYCHTKFKSYFQLKTHMVDHKNQQVYKCVMAKCGSTFEELDAFLEHVKTHETEMQYRCHLCTKYFQSLYDLGVHQYTHSLYPNQGPKPGPRHYQCTKCMNKYTTPEALEHHLSTTTHDFPCPHCRKKFTCERYLRRHLPTHGTEGQFECQVCEKSFKTEHYLKSHLLIHSGEKPFQCEVCETAFNRKDKLKRHMLLHDPIKRYKCPFKSLTGCNKEFNRPDKLKAHIIAHSGIKPYKCGECGKAFSRRPHLLEHERGHRAEYKYKCEQCGKGYNRPKLFDEHRCIPLKDGAKPREFRPRNKRRKVGRPKRQVIPDVKYHMKPSEKKKKSQPIVQVAVEKKSARNSLEHNKHAANSVRKTSQETQTITLTEEEPTDGHRSLEASVIAKHLGGYNDSQLVAFQNTGRQVDAYASDSHNAGHLVTNADGSKAVADNADHVLNQFVVQFADPGSHGSAHLTNIIPVTSAHLIPSHGSSELHNSIPVSTAQLITSHNGTAIHPITIIETNFHGSDGMPLVAISGNEQIPLHLTVESHDSTASSQVIAVGADNSVQRFGVSATHEVGDYQYGDSDPVLQGTEHLLKASEEILRCAHQQ